MTFKLQVNIVNLQKIDEIVTIILQEYGLLTYKYIIMTHILQNPTKAQNVYEKIAKVMKHE